MFSMKFFGISDWDAEHLSRAYKDYNGPDVLSFSDADFVRKIGENIYQNHKRISGLVEGTDENPKNNPNYFKYLDDEIHFEMKREARRLEISEDQVNYSDIRIRILRALAKRSIDFFLQEDFENLDLRTNLEPWIDRFKEI